MGAAKFQLAEQCSFHYCQNTSSNRRMLTSLNQLTVAISQLRVMLVINLMFILTISEISHGDIFKTYVLTSRIFDSGSEMIMAAP